MLRPLLGDLADGLQSEAQELEARRREWLMAGLAMLLHHPAQWTWDTFQIDYQWNYNKIIFLAAQRLGEHLPEFAEAIGEVRVTLAQMLSAAERDLPTTAGYHALLQFEIKDVNTFTELIEGPETSCWIRLDDGRPGFVSDDQKAIGQYIARQPFWMIRMLGRNWRAWDWWASGSSP